MSFRSRLMSSCLMMHISARSLMITNCSSPQWKSLIESMTNFSSHPIPWGVSLWHPSICNLTPLQTLALTAAAILCALSEYASGKRSTVMFSQDESQGTLCPSPAVNFTTDVTALINHTVRRMVPPPPPPLSSAIPRGLALLNSHWHFSA